MARCILNHYAIVILLRVDERAEKEAIGFVPRHTGVYNKEQRERR